ncbi:hypothetical protein [Pseudooceanicola marinus]|uniref:hypothetical protein n=1 Tax=Pseudooceanicola marinus TaxID=396013 RepID=UPI001CD565A9|nr:hypothetical protein [Pseudooceanicola marinus]MCA1337962.1 hypothetical protein [Pseudooceanicola marinus]
MDPHALLTAGLLTVADDDKKLHLLAGTAIALAARESDMTPLETCLLTLGAGLAKEAWDARGHGDVDFGDAAATAFGCQITLRF